MAGLLLFELRGGRGAGGGEDLLIGPDQILGRTGEDRIRIDINMNTGDGEARSWGCDLTEEYVKINGDYRT